MNFIYFILFWLVRSFSANSFFVICQVSNKTKRFQREFRIHLINIDERNLDWIARARFCVRSGIRCAFFFVLRLLCRCYLRIKIIYLHFVVKAIVFRSKCVCMFFFLFATLPDQLNLALIELPLQESAFHSMNFTSTLLDHTIAIAPCHTNSNQYTTIYRDEVNAHYATINFLFLFIGSVAIFAY